MSAEEFGQHFETAPGSAHANYFFKLQVCCPGYLIGIIAGPFARGRVGPGFEAGDSPETFTSHWIPVAPGRGVGVGGAGLHALPIRIHGGDTVIDQRRIRDCRRRIGRGVARDYFISFVYK